MKKILSLLMFVVTSFAYSQNYTVTGSLNSARWNHQSALLANKKVLTFGGDAGYLFPATVLATAELYNPSTGTWSYTGSMKKKRTNFSSVVLPNGNVLAIGGTMSWDGSDLYNTASCEIYNVTTGSWSYTDSLKVERYGSKAVLLKNGKVLITGGANDKTCELYDPSTNKWRYTGSNNTEFIYGMDLIMLKDGRVLATIGNSAELYDPQTESWITLANQLQGNRTYHSSTLLDDGRVLLAGSSEVSDQNTAEIFDPVTQTFTSTGSMSEYRSTCPMVTMDNGKVLIYGIGDFFTPSNTKLIEVYDPATGSWSSSTYTQIGAQSYRIQKLADGKFLALGGSFTTLNGASTGCILISQNIGACTQPSLSLSFTGGTTCIGKNTPLILSNSATGVSYSLSMGSVALEEISGNGNDIQFNVDGSILNKGNNVFSVNVKKAGCPTFILNDTAVLTASFLAAPVISPVGNYSICDGDSLLLSAPSGFANYAWTNNTLGQETYAKTAGSHSVIVKTADGCTSESSSPAILTFYPKVTPTINIVASSNPFTTGQTIVFTATPTNQGSNPVYQWSINGSPVGTNNLSYSSNTISHGDKVKCEMISNGLCISTPNVTSNIMTMINTSLAIPPVITSISPSSGFAGSSVVISGNNFSNIPSENIVYFGIARATIISASTNSITVEVPSNATYAPVTVTTTSTYTAYSPQPFNLTFCSGIFQPNSFANGISFNGLNTPRKTVVADIDSDGKTDIVFVESSDQKICIYKNTSSIGSISLANRIDYSLSSYPTELTLEDIDGDGKKDIIVTTEMENMVSVYKNTSTPGSISFASRVSFSTGNFPYGVLAKDINNDGKPEVIVANRSDNTISVFKNTSTGGNILFSARVNFATGTFPLYVAGGDLNGDSKSDLVISNLNSNTISVLRNTSTLSTISFAAKSDYVAGTVITELSLGDLNQDGKPEIVVANSGSKTISTYKNTSSGSIISFASKTDIPTSNSPTGVAVGNVDGDGNPDLVIGFSTYGVSTYRNNSSGGNISFDQPVSYLADNDVYGVTAGDIDGDGKTDIITATWTSSYHKITILKNQLDNQVIMTSPGAVEIFTGETIKLPLSSTGISSFNWIAQDNVNTLGESLTLQNNDTLINTITNSTVFDQPINYTVTPVFSTCGSVPQTLTIVVKALAPVITSVTPGYAPAGEQVVITGSNFSNNLSDNVVHFGSIKATVNSASQNSITVTVPQGSSYDFIKVTVNKNVSKSSQPFITTFDCAGPINTKTLVKYNDVTTAGTSSTSLSSDLNGDGQPDLITMNTTGSTISVSKNISSGSTIVFDTKNDYSTISSPNSIYTEDLNGDGKPEIIVGSLSANFSVFKNTSTTSTISFSPRMDITCPGSKKIFVNDVNGDGKMDIITLADVYTQQKMRVCRNTTTGTDISFAAFSMLNTTLYPYIAVIQDMDGDSKPDIVGVSAQSYPARFSIIKNTSTVNNISFGSETVVANTTSNVYKLLIGDLNNDQLPELITINDASFNLYKNTTTGGIFSFEAAVINNSIIPNNVAIGDINGDSKPDLVTGDVNQNLITIYKNSRNGSLLDFTQKITFNTTAVPRVILINDFNADGKPDLLSTDVSSFSIYENKMNEMMLTNPSTYEMINSTRLNIPLASDSARSYSWSANDNINITGESLTWNNTSIMNDSLINSTTIEQIVEYNIISVPATGSCPSVSETLKITVLPSFNILSLTPASAKIGDVITINGSGFDTTPNNNVVYFGKVKAEVITSQANQLTVKVPPGASYEPVSVTRNGKICFSKFPFVVTSTCMTPADKISFSPEYLQSFVNPRGVGHGDFDGDGKIDVIVYKSESISIFRNTTVAADISFANPYDLSGCTNIEDLKVGDINADGKLDIVTGCVHPDRVFSYYVNTSTPGNISFVQRNDISANGFNYWNVGLADLDGDNKLDVVNNACQVFRNSSTNNTVQFTQGPFVGGGSMTKVGDIDNDGKIDIVACDMYNSWREGIKIYRNISTPGNIVFAPKLELPMSETANTYELVDVDGDQKLDILVGNNNRPSYQIYKNTSTPGNPSFDTPLDFFDGYYLQFPMSINDMNNDGKPDAVIDEESTNSLFIVLENKSTTGTFNMQKNMFFNKANLNSNGRPWVSAGDIDGDGKVDVIAASELEDNFKIFRNTSSSLTITNRDTVVICNNNVSINLTSSKPSTFSWYAIDNPTTQGETTTVQTSSVINNTITSNSLPQIIKYKVTADNGTCLNTKTIFASISKLPVITVTASNPIVCPENSYRSDLVLNSTSELDYYYWKGSQIYYPYEERTSVVTNQTSSYRLFYVAKNGCADSSVTITITANNDCLPTAINNDSENKENTVDIYPNPATSFININQNVYSYIPNSGIEIYTPDGIIVKKMQLSSSLTKINISELKSGVYFIKYITDLNTSIYKMVKE